ncbi:MAG: dienelactone hydrolase family protein [Methylophaga sp.]|nr:dienelactone hydrolase family protein [Methylophaga sp.]
MIKQSMALALLLLSAQLSAEPVTYSYQDQRYQGYYLADKADQPLVLLLHDWNGLTDYEIKRAHMLSEQGYAVFAADLFGAGIRPTKDEDKRQHTGELYQDRAKMRGLIEAALKQAETLGADISNAVLMGYCFGGAGALEMARAGAEYRGFVSFHGGLATPEGQDYKKAQGALLILHGAADRHISLDDFNQLAKQLEQEHDNYEMIAYGGARHAFTEWNDDRYHAEADRRSWQRFLNFLEHTLQ